MVMTIIFSKSTVIQQQKNWMRFVRGHPLLIAHKSGHMGVMNTKAMEQMHLDKNTPDPAGGKKNGRDENGNLTGYAEESAFIKAGNQITHPDIHKIAKQFEKAQKFMRPTELQPRKTAL